MNLKERYTRVLDELVNAAAAANRRASDINLIAVSKTHPVALVDELAALGQVDFGENRIAELVDKQATTTAAGLRWHLIGQLQTNKVKLLTADVLLHTLDRLSLAEKLQQKFGGQEAPKSAADRMSSGQQTDGQDAFESAADRMSSGLQTGDTKQKIEALIQVNCSREPNKSGAAPEDFDALCEAVAAMPAIQVTGLMTIAENSDDEKTVRSAFALLRELSEKTRARGIFAGYQGILSMGMSGDFALAIAEGATHVRIGSAIFGSR